MILHGDCREVMAGMDAASVDAIVTDPPYGLSFMGKDWDHGIPGPPFWEQARRVAKPGAYLLAFGGTRTYHRLTCAIEDAGWEIKDCLTWLHGQGFPKHKSLLKPGWEPIVLAKKAGDSVLNIDACRLGTDDPLVRPDVRRIDNAIYGKGLGRGIQDEPTGRWPANVCLDEDAAAALDAQSGITANGRPNRVVGSPTRQSDITYGGGFGTQIGPTYLDTGGASRFFYVAKASRSERNAGLDEMPERGQWDDAQRNNLCGGPNRLNGSGKPTKPTIAANHHPTVKPVTLMRWLVRLVTPPGGTVLDPFAGSGTTGIACAIESLGFVGIEQNAEYVEIAERRIAYWTPEPLPLFVEAS